MFFSGVGEFSVPFSSVPCNKRYSLHRKFYMSHYSHLNFFIINGKESSEFSWMISTLRNLNNPNNLKRRFSVNGDLILFLINSYCIRDIF